MINVFIAMCMVFIQYTKGKRHNFYSINDAEGLTLKFKVFAGGRDEWAEKGSYHLR